jgi:nucleoside-diphosphate kinase
MADTDNYSFCCEWHDPQADILREYTMTIFVAPKGSIEVAMYDPKSKRSFLKRMPVPGLTLEDLRQDSIVTINSRQLRVKSYGDDRTRAALEAKLGSFILLTNPSAFRDFGQILSLLTGSGLRIGRLRLVNKDGPVVAMEALGNDAEDRWLQLCDMLGNAVTRVSAAEAKPYFEGMPTTAVFDNCTLCVIRPHAVKSGNAGAIISAIIESGFEISAAKMIQLGKPEANELLEVYKGVLPYHTDMVEGMVTSPCLALELRKDGDVIEGFRALCGPHDVDMAKHLRPSSLRARFGLDNAQNGVHCTDLEDDGESEVRFMFEVLAY